jgi:hypothetical protein
MSSASASSAGDDNKAPQPPPQELAPVQQCKGVNGLDKVVLREVRGCSAEVLRCAPLPPGFSCLLRPRVFWRPDPGADPWYGAVSYGPGNSSSSLGSVTSRVVLVFGSDPVPPDEKPQRNNDGSSQTSTIRNERR